MPSTDARSPDPQPPAPQYRSLLTTMQALDDAIAWRSDRLARPCPDCKPPRQCDEHGADHDLIATYQARHAAAFRALLDACDPADVAAIMQPGSSTPTEAAAMLALLAGLRTMTAATPAMLTLDGQPVIIDRDGDQLTEHPLT